MNHSTLRVPHATMPPMKTSLLAVAMLTAALALSACSGSDSPGGDVKSGQDVADLVGCTGFEPTSEEMFVTEGGPCDLDGEEITVYYFADSDAKDGWVEIASGFGDVSLTDGDWLVSAELATLDKLKADIGGSLTSD